MTMRLQLGSRAWERNSPRPFCRRCANYATAVTRHCTVIVLEHAPYMRLYLSRPVRRILFTFSSYNDHRNNNSSFRREKERFLRSYSQFLCKCNKNCTNL